MFADAGCALWDADAAVHRLYSKNGAAVEPIGAIFPEAVVDGQVSRDVLRDLIAEDASVLPELEKIVHPLVREDRALVTLNTKADVIVFDIPLLFETGAENEMDAVVCVSVSPELQEKRVLDRGTMTRDQFLSIRDKQMPNNAKCALSDFVITTETLEDTRRQVHHVLEQIKRRMANA